VTRQPVIDNRKIETRTVNRRLEARSAVRITIGEIRLACLLLFLAWPLLLTAQAPPPPDALSPLPPPVTRGLYRAHWFEFLNAHLEDDVNGAAAALAEMEKAARGVGVHLLSDFSRTAVHEGRRAEAGNRLQQARRAYDTAVRLDDVNVDAHLSRIGFFVRHRDWANVVRRIPELGVALLATQESRLALFSSVVIWAAAAFAAAVVAFVLALIVHHFPRIAHNLSEVSAHYLSPRAAVPLGLLLFALPFAFGLGPFWAALCWAALVFPYASKAERWALGVALVLLGFIPAVAAFVARENIIERSPLYVAAVDLEERREDGSAEDGLRQAATVFAEDPDVWFLLGMYAERAGDSERALISYDRAIAAESRDYRPYLNRGNVRFQEGDFTAAIRDYEAAASRSPRAAEIYYNLSIARGEAYDFDGQAAAMAKAREISERRVQGWTDRPTLARVISAAYPVSRAKRKVEEWNAQAKSRRLPGHAAPIRVTDFLISALTLGPWVLLGVGLLWTRTLEKRRALAGECDRCGKPFCSFCKRPGEPVLYCSDCIRLYLRKDSPGIEAQVAQTHEIRRRTRWKDWTCRVFSILLPGAHSELADRPVASFLVSFLFLFLIAVSTISVRVYDIRPLPPPRSWRAIVFAPLALAAIVWLFSQRNAWKESHGP